MRTDHTYDPYLVIPRRRSRTTRLQLLTRRDAGHVLKAAMTIPALAGQASAGMQSR